ncbi:hypothetical protein B5C34_11495 [Pacificimonas flava]|uniref:Diguanylate cyclase n=2 Tax=Pacificimonas TaxID=1960290 RepID=A0A219B6K8_9SPHN|nr:MULTISPECIES: EAL domain-containing protein [Pacificimonas]MBZ6378709.1 GGDEF domain-containing protein [Pacificimonas aurantium]OWV34022.1 hypothetical protein B5C34_11495 [Pacificimonas flava]
MKKAPVLLLSIRYEREVKAVLEQAGKSVLLAAPDSDVGRAYRNSSAFIALVDARGAIELGLAKAAELSQHVADRRGAMLVLLSRKDAQSLDRVYEVGATHYLVSPFGGDQLLSALRFAERMIERMRTSGTEAALAQAQDYLQQSPRWYWSAGSNTVRLNDDLSALLGLTGAEEVPLRMLARLLPVRELADFRAAMRPLLEAEVSGPVDHPLNLPDKKTRLVHHVSPVHGENGEFSGLMAAVEDIFETATQKRLSAHFDSLTGLASLSSIRARIDEALVADRDPQVGAIAVLIGLSRFDQINASFGRHVADLLLQAVSRRLRRLIEERGFDNTVAARLGGTEFAVVFFGPIQLNQGVFFSQLVSGIFDRPFIIEGRRIYLSCRIGIAASDPDMTSSDELLRAATSALASARSLGPNAFQVYLSGHDTDPVRLATLEQSVRDAARSGELDLRYQPQVDASNNQIVGVEALLRYEHPVYGQLTADTLLSTAERGEFGVEFGRSILRQAFREAASWPSDMQHLRLSVNVTAADMRDTEFVSSLIDSLSQANFPPDRLTLEITEGSLVENLEHTADMLSALKRRDIRIAIDDFGTGYSSLAYLKALPLDYLKIDKRIAADITGETRDKIIVRGVIDMARSLDMTVVAEGVESETQLDLLIRAGCNWYQGFLCAGAMPTDEMVPFIRHWNKAAGKKVANS